MDKIVGKTFKAKVKCSDIKKGCENKSNECPIARAVNRCFKDVFGDLYNGVIVNADRIRFFVDDNPMSVFVFKNTRYISGWIANYDEGQDVNSIEFSMTVKTKSVFDNGIHLFVGEINQVR